MLTGRLGSTRPNIATGWELEIITMVILGGVGIAAGTGTGGVQLAVLTMGTLDLRHDYGERARQLHDHRRGLAAGGRTAACR